MKNDTRIFGYEWADIQRAQQKLGSLNRSFDVSKSSGAQPATDADRKLLEQHGSVEALRAAGLHGVVDRLAHDNQQLA